VTRTAAPPMRVASLHVYPVKGCHRIDLDHAAVEPWGLAGDRRWLPVDANGKLVSQREVRALATVRPRLTDMGVRLSAPGLDALDVAARPSRRPCGTTASRPPPAAPRRTRGSRGSRAGTCGSCGWTTRRVDRSNRAGRGPATSSARRTATRSSSPASSLDAVNTWIAAESAPDEVVPMTRFRPSLVVGRAPPGAAAHPRPAPQRRPAAPVRGEPADGRPGHGARG